jgi:hypothetical protein
VGYATVGIEIRAYPTLRKKREGWGTLGFVAFCEMWGTGAAQILERETGIEPATNGLGSRYSTIELLPPAQRE